MKMRQFENTNGRVFIKPSAVSSIAANFEMADPKSGKKRPQTEIGLKCGFVQVWGTPEEVKTTLEIPDEELPY